MSGLGIKERNSKKLRVTFCGYRSWELTDPYPNIYMGDNAGNRLYFKEVEYHGNTGEEFQEL